MSDWTDICALSAIPQRGSRTLRLGGEPVALFRTHDDRIFALIDRCPHKNGPLSQGIVHGHAVTCPLHNYRIALATGEATGGDKGCTPTLAVEVREGRVFIARPIQAAA